MIKPPGQAPPGQEPPQVAWSALKRAQTMHDTARALCDEYTATGRPAPSLADALRSVQVAMLILALEDLEQTVREGTGQA